MPDCNRRRPARLLCLVAAGLAVLLVDRRRCFTASWIRPMYALSDGSPGFELLTGIAVLAQDFVLGPWRPVAGYCDAATAALASGLRRIGFFPASDVEIEVHRLDLLRIPLAFFLFRRFYQDLLTQILAGNSASILWIS